MGVGGDAEGVGVERAATFHQDGDATVLSGGRSSDGLGHFQERGRRAQPGVCRTRPSGSPVPPCPPGRSRSGRCRDTVAVTVAVAPSAVSVTVHTEPAGMPSKLCDTLPAGVPAAITKSGDRAVPLQTTWMVTGPWWPASGAGDGLGDEQGAGGGAVGVGDVGGRSPAGGMVTVCGLPVTTAETALVAPSAVSVTTQLGRRGDTRVDLRLVARRALAAMTKSGIGRCRCRPCG